VTEQRPVACEACGEITQQLMELTNDLNLAETDLRRARRARSRLEGERAYALTAHPLYPKAEQVLTGWQDICMPTAREPFSETRVKPVLKRLEFFSPEELLTCCQGYARYPFLVHGRRSAYGHEVDRFVEAEFIFRKPQHVQRGIQMANAEDHGVPVAVLAKVSWRKVWLANRHLIIQALRRHWGHDGIEGSYRDLLWPCPFCVGEDPDRATSLTLAVYNEPGLKLAECSMCGMTEDRLLRAVLDAGSLV